MGGMASCDNLNNIRKIQNKCMKMIWPKSLAKNTFKELNLLDLTKLIDLENKKLGYKISKKLLPAHMLEIIQSDSKNKTPMKKHKYNMRNKKTPYLPKTKSSVYQCSFLYCGLQSLTKLSPELLSQSNIKSFVNK